MSDLHLSPAETALSILFRKLHPHLEDAAHALSRAASLREMERMHLKLLAARMKAIEVMEAVYEPLDENDALREILETLASNLTPVGESYRQSLILTQLCLEEAPADLLPFLPEQACQSPWGIRMQNFLHQLDDPKHHAEARWAAIHEDIGETEEG